MSWCRTVLDSLLKQNIAVLTATILGALLVSLVLITALVLRPQIERSAADTAQMIRSLDLSFQQMDKFQQILFAEALRADAAPEVEVADAAPEGANRPRSWFAGYFLRVLEDRHEIDLANIRVDDEGRVWVRMPTADQPYWMSLRNLPASDPIAGLAIAFAIALAAALAGGIALQQRVVRPLRRLETAVGRLSNPTDLFESDMDRPREIAAVSRALSGMSARLRAAEANRALMLAGVSHDLRTPLTKLRLSLAMLKDVDPDLLAGAERNVIRIETMLGQFLDVARGFEAEATRAVSLVPLLRQAIAGCDQPDAVTLGPPGDIEVVVREAAVVRALENLLNNALRHGRPPVVLAARVEGGALLLEVSDAGDGVPEAARQDLMAPFARGNAARTGEGTGLGLAIVDQVARAHGGTVEFDEGAAGFTVRLRLPQPSVDGAGL
jgi:two-component system osmolarity sensor histidine kinase EnvZ